MFHPSPFRQLRGPGPGRAGTRLSASEYNRLVSEVKDHSYNWALGRTVDGAGIRDAEPQDITLLVQLLDYDSVTKSYTWRQVYSKSDGTYDTNTWFIEGNPTWYPAFELNDQLTALGTIVELLPGDGPFFVFLSPGGSTTRITNNVTYAGDTVTYDDDSTVIFEGDVWFQHLACYDKFTDTLTDSQYDDYEGSTKPWWRLSTETSATYPISGILAPDGEDEGCEIVITNLGPGIIDLLDQDPGSDSENRIITPSGDTWSLDVDDSAILRYDRAASRWRIIDREVSSSSGLEVKESDGAPDYPGISILVIDVSNQGLSISQPGAGQAKITVAVAGHDAVGVINRSNQTLGAGAKYFLDKVGVGTESPLSNTSLDVRGYGYVYFAQAISFGGGNFPIGESDGCILSWDTLHTVNLSPPSGLSGAFRFNVAGTGSILSLNGTDGITGTFP